MRTVLRYLLLTFGSTWALWALVVRGGDAAGLALGGPVFLLGVFAPGLIAVALTAAEGGRGATDALLRRVVRWRVGIRYYAVAMLLIPLVKVAVAGAFRAMTGAWPRFGHTHPLLLVLATIFSTVGQAGEEVGWRGWLLPRVAARTGLARASLLVGVLWATWHLPLFFAPGADTNGQSFPLYALQVTAYSVVLTWLYSRTGGSLLLPMLAHAAFNNMRDLVPSGRVAHGGVFTLDSTLVFRLTVLLLWVVGAFFLARLRRAG